MSDPRRQSCLVQSRQVSISLRFSRLPTIRCRAVLTKDLLNAQRVCSHNGDRTPSITRLSTARLPEPPHGEFLATTSIGIPQRAAPLPTFLSSTRALPCNLEATVNVAHRLEPYLGQDDSRGSSPRSDLSFVPSISIEEDTRQMAAQANDSGHVAATGDPIEMAALSCIEAKYLVGQCVAMDCNAVIPLRRLFHEVDHLSTTGSS